MSDGPMTTTFPFKQAGPGGVAISCEARSGGLPDSSPDEAGLISSGIEKRLERGGGAAGLLLVRQDHAADTVPEEPTHDHVAGEVPREGHARGPNQARCAVSHPGDPSVVFVHLGEDRGDGEGPGGVTGGERSHGLPRTVVVIEKLPPRTPRGTRARRDGLQGGTPETGGQQGLGGQAGGLCKAVVVAPPADEIARADQCGTGGGVSDEGESPRYSSPRPRVSFWT